MADVHSLADVSVNFVDSLESAAECIRWAESLSETVALDTETTGLEWWTPNFIRMVQIGNRDVAWAIPVREWWTVARSVCQIVKDKQIPVVMWNCKFDVHSLESEGFPVPDWHLIHDGKVAHHLLIPHANHSLKPTAERMFGTAAVAGDRWLKMVKAENGWDWATVPVDHPAYWAYSALDCIITRRVWDDLWPQVEAQFLPQYEREMAVQAIMHRCERRGLRIDRDYTRRLRDEWELEAVNLAIGLEAGGIKNPLSNRQVEQVLRALDWEPDDFTPTGAAKLDKVVLAQLSRHPDFGKLAEPLIRYKRLVKWMKVYLDRFINDADANGYVHASINTMEARTGRMSITQPPLQTLPSKDPAIRNCVLPDDGMKLWAVDYQAQEARLFVNYAQDAELMDVIHSGRDLYTYFAQVVFNDPSITKDSPLRSMFKVMVLAFFYGAGVPKLALITDQPESEVYDQLKRLFYAFPSVANMTGDHAVGGSNKGMFSRAAAERLASEGMAYVLTAGGRRFSMEEDALYKAVNGVMQGSGADVLKDAAIRLDRAGCGDNIVVPVHDELVFQFPDSPEGAEAAAEAALLMEDASFPVPLVTELSGPLDSWGSKYA